MIKLPDKRSTKLFFDGLIGLLLCCYISPLKAQTVLSEPDSSLLASGMQLLNSGQYQALIDWERREFPKDATFTPALRTAVLTLRANALRHLGQLRQALAIHNEVLTERKRLYGFYSVEVANTYQNIGNCWLDLGEPEKALEYLEPTRKIREKVLGKQHDQLASAYNSLAAAYTAQSSFDQADLYLIRALQIRRLARSGSPDKIAGIQLNRANLFLKQEQYDKAYSLLADLKQEADKDDDLTQRLRAMIYQNLGNCLLRQGKWQEALQLIREAVRISGSFPGGIRLYADCLASLGQCLLSLHEPDQAEAALQEALQIYQKNESGNDPSVAEVYNDLGLCYQYRDQFTVAFSYYDQALTFYLNAPSNAFEHEIGIYGNIGRCLMQQGNPVVARYYFEKALRLQDQSYPAPEKQEVFLLLFMGNSYLQEKLPKKALTYFENANSAYRYISTPDPLLEQYINYCLGQANSDLGALNTAVRYFNLGLAGLRSIRLPRSANGSLYPYEKSQLLMGRAQAFYRQGRREGSRASLMLALQSYQEADTLVRRQLSGLKYERSVVYLQDDFHLLYSHLIELCYHLSRDDPAFIQLAFQYSEYYRSIQLREILSKEKAVAFAGVPDSLVRQQQQIRQAQVMQAEWCRKMEEEAFPNRAKLVEAYEQLQDLREQQEKLESYIQSHYPTYAEITQNYRLPPTLDSTRQWLWAKQSLIEYILTDSMILTFVVNPDTVVLNAQKRSPLLSQEVETFYELLKTRPDLVPDRDARYKRYNELAHQLYQLLIAPVSEYLKEELIIVPDGILYYLPFEALIKQPGQYPHLFAQHHYLIREHPISYTYSVAALFLLEEREQAPVRNRLLAIAPTFESNPELSELSYNVGEVKVVSSLLETVSWIGEEAHKDRFLADGNQYRFLLLATHGALDADQSDRSFLAFWSDSTSRKSSAYKLYLSEVYGIHLPAELVTLSACQTGLGQLRRGESLISMARAFTYAGAKSIVASLWSIDDQQTSRLIEGFYRNLADGLPKNRSLQKSKLAYLEQCTQEELAHPYYWTALITIGDLRAVENIPSATPFFYYLGLGICGLIGLLFVIARLLKRTQNRS